MIYLNKMRVFFVVCVLLIHGVFVYAQSQEKESPKELLKTLEAALFPANVPNEDSIYGQINLGGKIHYYKARKNLPSLDSVMHILYKIRTRSKEMLRYRNRLLELYHQSEDMWVKEFGKGPPMCEAHYKMWRLNNRLEETLLFLAIENDFADAEARYEYCKKHYIYLSYEGPEPKDWNEFYFFSKNFQEEKKNGNGRYGTLVGTYLIEKVSELYPHMIKDIEWLRIAKDYKNDKYHVALMMFYRHPIRQAIQNIDDKRIDEIYRNKLAHFVKEDFLGTLYFDMLLQRPNNTENIAFLLQNVLLNTFNEKQEFNCLSALSMMGKDIAQKSVAYLLSALENKYAPTPMKNKALAVLLDTFHQEPSAKAYFKKNNITKE